MNKILIIGASGFIGNAIYKELLSYYDVYGTYCHQSGTFENNQVFFHYDVQEDSLGSILYNVNPDVVISSLRGEFDGQFRAHQQLCEYIRNKKDSRLLFLSSVNVFDAKWRYPSYEDDLPEAESEYGKFKISVERLLMNLPPKQYAILRLPLVLGVNAPRVFQLKQASRHQAGFEVYPNLIISVTTADKIAQQIHYIINKSLSGIFHLASKDVVHHQDLFQELTDKLCSEDPVFKSVFSSNEDRYLAILPKKNKLPKPYRITVAEVIEDSTLNEEIITLKQ